MCKQTKITFRQFFFIFVLTQINSNSSNIFSPYTHRKMGKKIAHQKRISKIKIKEVHFFCQRLKIFQTDWFLKNQNNDKVNNIYASKIKIIQCPGLFPVEVGTVPEMDLFDVVFQRVLRHKLLFAQRAFSHLRTLNKC